MLELNEQIKNNLKPAIFLSAMFLFDNMVRYADGKVCLGKGGQLNLVSHAHFDHLPSSFKNDVICSEITRKMIEIRAQKVIGPVEHEDVLQLDSGHTLGSRMFFLQKDGLLYTGDFNTIPKPFGCAKPRKCSTLVVECTYGCEKYIFPPYDEVVRDFVDYLKDNGKAAIKVYSFGKAQEICSILDKHKVPFCVRDPSIRNINEGLGLSFGYEDDKADVVLSSEVPKHHKKVVLSGWAIESSFQYWNRADAAFVLSDHADYPSLVHFVTACKPDRIYTYHGFAVEFAESLRKAGFDAKPLLKNQKRLDEYN